MSDILKIRDYVYQETGMYFPDEKQYYFESRFKRRMDELGMNTFVQYHQHLKADGRRREELNRLMNELTINETSFFRNMPQFKALQETVLPDIIQAKSDSAFKKLKIWSAGCSSGEEPYTMSMIVSDMVASGKLANWNIEIKGTDISNRVLDIAQKGVYKDYAIKNMPENFKKKYITPAEGGHKVDDSLRKYVKFSHLNLSDDMGMVFMKGFDIIFCKNVLIYFDNESKKRVIHHFFNSLNVGGYLFIGFSESLFGISDRFKLIHYPGGMVYRKVVHK